MAQVPNSGGQQVAPPQIRTPSECARPSDTFVTTLYVTNIHCQSCVSYATDILRPITEVTKVDISIADHSIRVQHHGDVASMIEKELTDASFEVQHLKMSDSKGVIVHEYKPQPCPRRAWAGPFFMSEAQKRHLNNCNACKAQAANKKRTSAGKVSRYIHQRRMNGTNAQSTSAACDNLENQQEKPAIINVDRPSHDDSPDPQGTIFKATISIGGMTCAACVGTVTKELEVLDNVRSVSVSLLANNATVKFQGPKNNVDNIVEAIEDVGFEATLDEVIAEPTTSQQHDLASHQFKATLSIEGMTCGSCVGTITRGLQEFSFVTNVNIDLVGCSGVVEFENKDNLESILQKIDDLGYDAAVIKVESCDASETENDGPRERTVVIAIDGMYSEHCPERIMKAFILAVGDSVLINQRPTLNDPRLSVTYTPQPPDLTARRFISIINSSHETFSAAIDRPPSVEERSRAIQHREQRHILLRLLFTLCVAIPTFVIGIVYMSLVPSTNKTRMWFEEPLWSGQASRTEWALFIMTTPVMFFGADVFHVRAFKQLRALWRPGSRVPILRRFYRFGSMNLLISAGTSVAYFSSLAVLILDASSPRGQTNGSRGNNTYFDSVTFLTFFILIGKFLEAYSKAKTGDAVAMLSNLRPSEAVLVESNSKEDAEQVTTTRVSVDLLEVGDVVSVPHGASPPMDGTVNQDGTFLFDESSLTGESKPVKKGPGDKVFAGSVNISHPVRVQVTEIGGTSMLDQIVAVVREGQTKRAPIERVADVITGYFVPVITLIAITTFVIWLALGESGALPKRWLDVAQGGWAFWSLEFAISVFVVACPCGIALAAPTALFVGGGLAAKHGILVQGGGEAFQEASKLDVIVFDKTGTLTEGKMKVTHCETLANRYDRGHQDELAVAFALAKALEEASSHPIAKAIVEFCSEKQQQVNLAYHVVQGQVEEIPGKGMQGTFKLRNPLSDSDHTVTYEAGIGNQALYSTAAGAARSDYFLDTLLSKFQNLGHSTAIFSLRRLSDSTTRDQEGPRSSAESSEAPYRPILVFAISDPLRKTTAAVLQTLQVQHNLSVHMCTGDNETTARAIASQVGIPASQVRAGVLPQDKAAYIQELQLVNGKRRLVAFVGDGTNDAAALAAADVSIALSSGSDVAINSASFILLNSDLQTVLELVRLAKRVFWRVKANFVWAAVYNVALVPVAAGVFYPIGSHWRLGPVWSSAAMAASSISVVTSSLALRLPEVQLRLPKVQWRLPAVRWRLLEVQWKPREVQWGRMN
jgi:heavy metal translocating P-type ATPase